MTYEALLIAGRAGVGKTSVAYEVSVLLQADRVAHCVVEGDAMDQVHPAPADDPSRTRITERNLAAVWANYVALGQRRLIYTNTVSILDAPMIARALDGSTRMTYVLLTAEDATVQGRLARRETGSQLQAHVERSAAMARHLDAQAPEDTVRVPTDSRSVDEIAGEVRLATGW